jgi:hypothetical protein
LSLGLNFPSLFDGLPTDERRRIGRIARLQVVQKRKWLHKVWQQFDPSATEESLLETLRTLAEDEGEGMNGLFQSAKDVARRFLWVDASGLFPSIRCFVMGPRFGGKTTFLRTILLEFMVIFSNAGIFKSVFIVGLDFRRATFDSIESFYEFISDAAVTALLAQRPDVELFAHSLTTGFSALLKLSRVMRLPKPLSSQDYLRRPMRMIEGLLTNLHRLYHERGMQMQFLERVAAIPQTVAEIFGFPVTLLVIDHLDLLPRIVSGLDFLKPMTEAIGRVQSIVSAANCEVVLPLRKDWNIVSVTDKCKSSFSDRQLIVSFKRPGIPEVTIDVLSCGGCPTFVSRFDDICQSLLKREGIADEIKREEQRIRSIMLVEILLDMLMSFGEFEEDGGPPQVREVLLRTAPEREPEPEQALRHSPVDEYSDD